MRQPWTDDARLLNPNERRHFGDAFERLVGIMARLRGPGGCPWDHEQTLETLKAYLVEETYEVLDALDRQHVVDHKEELGDLLLQVVFQAELRREERAFDAADVVHGICDKLIRRHPHVFGDAHADAAAQAFEHWEAMKAKEKAGRSAIDGVPRALPALLRAQRMTEKASRAGFDWQNVEGPLEKLSEELGELKEAVASGVGIEDEVGDVLLTIANVCRFLGVSAEDALQKASTRFDKRFRAIEAKSRAAGRALTEHSERELDEMWEAAKIES